jgi:hypothetical protein
MALIRLTHGSTLDDQDRAIELRRLGHLFDARLTPVPELARLLAASPPVAIVIDLTRSPSGGHVIRLVRR